VKVSSTQSAGKILPAKVSGIKTPARDFFAVLAEEQAVEKSVSPKYQDIGSSHNGMGVKVKASGKDDTGTKAQSMPLPPSSVPKTLPLMPIASPPASLPTMHEDSEHVLPAGDQKPANPHAGEVSSSTPSALFIENAYRPQPEVPATLTGAPQARNPGSVDSIHSQHPAVTQPIHELSQAGEMQLSPDLLPVASKELATAPLANIPAAKASDETPAQTHSGTGALPTNVLNAKENQATRSTHNWQSSASTLDSAFQRSISALKSRAEATEAVKAAINPVLPSSNLTPTGDHTRQFVPPETRKNASQGEETRTQSFSGAGTDASNHSSHRANNEAKSSAPVATAQDHPQNATPTPTSKPEVQPAVQVLHTAVASKTPVRETADKVSTPMAPGLAHGLSGPAHLNTEEGAVAVPIYAVHAAKLVERLGASELRVGVNAGELGKVDIRTSLGHNQFTAEISVERGELGRVLAAELPNLHTRLSEQHLPTANITVQDFSAGTSGDHRGSQQPRTPAMMNASSSVAEHEASWLAPVFDAAESSTGLDIHM